MFGSKKVIIKPFKSQTGGLRVDNGESIWNSVASSIDVIFTRQVTTMSFESTYTSCYNLVTMKKSDLLYNGIREKIKQNLMTELQQLRGLSDELLLPHLVQLFDNFKLSVEMIRDIAMYLEQYFIRSREKIGICSMGLVSFRNIVINSSFVLPRITDILVSMVRSDRDGYVIDKTVVLKTLRMLTEISVHQQANEHAYVDLFETPFLEESRAYYEQEAQNVLILQESTLAAYCTKAEQRLLEENGRLDSYILRATEKKLRAVLHDTWIAQHAKFLFAMEQNGFVSLLQGHQLADIKKFFGLCVRLPEVLQMLRDNFYQYVRDRGMAILSDTSGENVAVTCISKLTELKINSSNVLVQCFQNDAAAMKRLKDALDETINLDARCANYLAIYMDNILRGVSSGIELTAPLPPSSSSSSSTSASSAPGGSDVDQDRSVEQMMSLFKHIHDKDVFENYYKGLLSKRLLGNKNVSDELEKAVLRKLKAECGYQFTSKMEGMFTDISLSKLVLEEFRASARVSAMEMESASSLELDVTILTSGYWPNISTSTSAVLLPKVINDSISAYTAFYLTKHNGRKISWLTSLGNADIRIRFNSNCSKEFNVSTLQMSILSLYETVATHSLQEIKEACGVDDVIELKRHLLSLTTPKAKILLKSSKGKTMSDSDVFTLNETFESKFRRIKVPLIALKEITGSSSSDAASSSSPNAVGTVGGTNGLSPEVEESRKLATEAAIVRVMKARKTMRHNELLAEVSRQLAHRFHATLVEVKKCIESLIEREYLCRDHDERSTYKYLA